jgi:hypothetical protein
LLPTLVEIFPRDSNSHGTPPDAETPTLRDMGIYALYECWSISIGGAMLASFGFVLSLFFPDHVSARLQYLSVTPFLVLSCFGILYGIRIFLLLYFKLRMQKADSL